MSSDVYVMACIHDKLGSTSWLDFGGQIPDSNKKYPLQRDSTWVGAYGLDYRPNQQDEYEVVDDEEDYCSEVAPGVDIED